MTGKERAKFRSQAHARTPVFQIGKNGVTDAVIAQTDEVLTAKELIKVKILLESCPEKPKDAAVKLSAATGAEIIGVIGGVVILYRYSEELHEKQAKKEANKRAAARAAAGNNYGGRYDKELKWRR